MSSGVTHGQQGSQPVSTFRELALDLLFESTHNPRRHFDEAGLQELAASIRKAGVLTPLIVRPAGKHRYEIAAGHRRFRASKAALLDSVPCLVREMDDQTFMEILTVENLQREDVHPLDEAKGYEALMAAPYRMDVQRIAEKVGRSIRYIYDRVGLLKLTPAAQEFFWEGHITAGHAVILARLSPADQKQVIGTADRGFDDGGLFQNDHGLFAPDQDGEKIPHPLPGLKAVSVMELQSFINARVRFDPKKAEPILFPETVVTVAKAIEEEQKLIPITHDYHVRPEAKDGNTRTYGPMSWARADGKEGSKTCAHSVMGVIVVGAGRGEAFEVCIEKKKCLVHWKEEVKAAEAKAKGGAESPGAKSAEDKAAKERKRQQDIQARLKEREAQWEKMIPKIEAAVMERVRALPATSVSVLGDMLVKQLPRHRSSKGMSFPRGKSAEELVRYLAALVLTGDIRGWRACEEFPAQAKALGVDLSPFVKLEKAKKGTAA